LGNVLIDSHTFVGAGAIIREGKRGDPRLIGSDVTIGMGSIVLGNVPAGSTFVGNPAFDIRKN
jgi:acetyltransferase-like isoleucine patch superfamily enzyme